ncbi:hypothetical protein ABZ746_12570 [Streptomyces sp. NPDC020096]
MTSDYPEVPSATSGAAERAEFRREGLLRGWREIGGERRDMVLFALLPGDI